MADHDLEALYKRILTDLAALQQNMYDRLDKQDRMLRDIESQLAQLGSQISAIRSAQR